MGTVISIQAAIQIIDRSGLFDREWYLRSYKDVDLLGLDPIHHYLWVGRRLNRIPAPDAQPGADLLSLLALNVERVRPPSISTPDRCWGSAPDHEVTSTLNVREGRQEPTEAKDVGTSTWRRIDALHEPSAAIFDAKWYQETYSSLIAHGTDPWEHFISDGRRLGLQPNEYFSPQWYLQSNPDVANAEVDPVDHYVRYGAKEGRSCGPLFVQGLYEAQLQDPVPSEIIPLAHYLEQPVREKFIVTPQKISQEVLDDTLGVGVRLEPCRIAVGIVAFKQSVQELETVISSAKAAIAACGDLVSGKVLVIDNGGTIDPSSFAPDVQFLAGKGNVGFGRGQNSLMKVAFSEGADCYVGANPDGAFHPDCIVNMLKMNKRHAGAALIEALQFPEEHPKFYHPESLETDWCSGACFLLPRQIFQITGGFDPEIFLYCEDVDFSWRVRQAGFKLLTCPLSLFYHDVSDRKYNAFIRKEMLLAGRYLAQKWGSASFRRYAETQLISEKFAPSASELPDLNSVSQFSAPPKFVNFGRQFSFATTRW